MTTLSGLGAFFVVEPLEADAAWRPITDLLTGDALAERIAWTGDALGRIAGVQVEARIAASTFSLGIFARLLSPAIGASLLDTEAPRPGALHWQPVAGGPLRLAADDWVPARPGDVIDELCAPLVARLDAEHQMSPKIGWGNVASAVHGAVRMATAAVAQLAPQAGQLLDDLFAHPQLSGTADLGPPFARRSCCLYYRLPGGGYCGDCVLTDT